MTELMTLLLAGAAGAVLGGVVSGSRGTPRGWAPAGCTATGESALVLFCIDDLGSLREEFGEDVADRLQDRVVGILRRTAPPGARFEHRSGAGHVVLTIHGTPLEAVGGIAESARRLAALATVEAGGRRVGRTVSAAVVALGADAEGALRAAAALLAAGTRRGGDRIVTPDDDLAAVEAADVVDAIRSGALRYHVQPILALRTGRAVGVEALLRWTAGGRIVRMPAQFLHRTEWLPEGAIVRLADLAGEAARPFVERPDPLDVAFNVTADALEAPRGPQGRWLAALVDRLPPERIVLELLETTVVARPDAAIRTIAALRGRGVRVALDDFGTGLSNLDRLLAIRPDLVKIDRALIVTGGTDARQDNRREAVIGALVGLTRRLGMALIAEGLETEADVEAARRLGIAFGQGFHLGRPAPVEHWAARLR